MHDFAKAVCDLVLADPASKIGGSHDVPKFDDVQTISHPVPSVLPQTSRPTNRLREQLLRKYPFLVDKEKLVDKEDPTILWSPDDPMISTYKRDFCCDSQEFGLSRTPGTTDPALFSKSEVSSKSFRPRYCPSIVKDLSTLYTLPDGRWALSQNAKTKEIPLPPPAPKEPQYYLWESEYQANINGMARYMKNIGALTKHSCRVRRMPTLIWKEA